jgi:hypothetical protein
MEMKAKSKSLKMKQGKNCTMQNPTSREQLELPLFATAESHQQNKETTSLDKSSSCKTTFYNGEYDDRSNTQSESGHNYTVAPGTRDSKKSRGSAFRTAPGLVVDWTAPNRSSAGPADPGPRHL